MSYLIVKYVHILSATFMFGTGLGTAFYMFVVNRSANTQAIAVVTRYVVLADWIFTTPTVILQPLTGFYLARQAGLTIVDDWLLWAVVLYALVGTCWLPVVWLQLRMRDMASVAAREQQALSDRYWRYERYWIALGIPAFIGMFVLYYLMIFKPT